jgi:hypothetical protein
MSIREQGLAPQHPERYYNQNVGDATKFLYNPDFSKPAY